MVYNTRSVTRRQHYNTPTTSHRVSRLSNRGSSLVRAIRNYGPALVRAYGGDYVPIARQAGFHLARRALGALGRRASSASSSAMSGIVGGSTKKKNLTNYPNHGTTTTRCFYRHVFNKKPPSVVPGLMKQTGLKTQVNSAGYHLTSTPGVKSVSLFDSLINETKLISVASDCGAGAATSTSAELKTFLKSVKDEYIITNNENTMCEFWLYYIVAKRMIHLMLNLSLGGEISLTLKLAVLIQRI